MLELTVSFLMEVLLYGIGRGTVPIVVCQLIGACVLAAFIRLCIVFFS